MTRANLSPAKLRSKATVTVRPHADFAPAKQSKDTLTIPMRIDWAPVKNARRAVIPRGAIKTSVPDLCRRAQIPVRATTDRDVYVYRGRKKIRTPTYDLVGVPADPNTPRGALRALESLAHSFFDHFARHCVCKRGLFSVSTQRTWQSTKSPKLRGMRNHKRPPATRD